MMLQLHDLMKDDTAYQAGAPQTAVRLSGRDRAWMAFTDQVSHAAMAGQYQLEQTFLSAGRSHALAGTIAAPRPRAPEGPRARLISGPQSLVA